MQSKLGIHESLELHELLTFKSLCLTKSTIMKLLVSDEKLKGIMQEDVEKSSKHIKELKKFMS